MSRDAMHGSAPVAGRVAASGGRLLVARLAWLATAGVVALIALSGAAPASAAESCPNAQLRAEDNSKELPDCRAYEMVSPAETNGFNVAYGTKGSGSAPLFAAPAAPSGNLVSYYAYGSFAGNPTSAYINQYLSTRTSSGWASQGISPEKQALFYGIDVHTSFVGFSSDLADMAAVNWVAPGLYALLLRNESGDFTTIAEGSSTTPPIFAGASEGFSHVLVVQSIGGNRLYEWSEGKLSLISEVEGTESLGAAGGYTGPFGAAWGRAISTDGSRVYWTDETGSEGPYLYENGTQTNIAASQCTTGNSGATGAGGNCAAPGSGYGTFQTSTPNGEVAFFTSEDELTNEANTGAGNEGGDLYRFDAGNGELTDLTPDAGEEHGAEVQGVLGTSEDGSYVYFVANGVLASGASQGACAIGSQAATCNLYLWHDGTITFLATVSGADEYEWLYDETGLEHSSLTQTTPDGQQLLFTSVASPTSYDSEGDSEIYLYDAGTGKLNCVSCNPTGAPPAGNASLGSSDDGPQDGGTSYDNITTNGDRVFFQSNDSLLRQDENGLENVYEWEADGTGSCKSEARNGGCLYSISTGTSAAPDYFQNATPSGNDVFFLSQQQLVGQDTNGLVALYDARVEGGFPAPAKPASPCAEATKCQGQEPSGSVQTTPGSELVSGARNLAPPTTTSSKQTTTAKKKKKLTRQQKLKRALQSCKKQPKRLHKPCEARARKRYGGGTSKSANAKADDRSKSTKKGSGR